MLVLTMVTKSVDLIGNESQTNGDKPFVVLETKGLEKLYDKEIHAVKGIDIELYKGEVFGLLGPNGAGKTTTIAMLLGITKKSKGEIKILGKTYDSLKEIHEFVGYAPQGLVFYPFLTVQENAVLFADCYEVINKKDRISNLLELFQLAKLKYRPAGKLSGGQQRRLNLLLGMIHSPKILFLDEPSAGMDPQSRNILWENVRRFAKEEDISIILTTHIMEVAERLCDRVAIIDYGKIIAKGTPTELKSIFNDEEIVELYFSDQIEQSVLEKLKSTLSDKYPQTTLVSNAIKIQTKNGAKEIPQIVELVEKFGAMTFVDNLQLRESSLEDVFLSLTGKTLRE